ncbi:hypothetical protein BLA39750_07827 [Burkholderia lata]|uniref:Uncharacterized protein n=1 Tax=Burkholderia lata (strain ATCC 17760 / DSM 23089 / LMG 22485 / NCIMB 9086 / R18194 / 383) TaxID=482957 RepID=A0A6P3C726_BURL3|nr:hypothetical protein BLA39750_07827 [Burkholderia lata]
MIQIHASRTVRCPASPAMVRHPAHCARVDGPEART